MILKSLNAMFFLVIIADLGGLHLNFALLLPQKYKGYKQGNERINIDMFWKSYTIC